MKTPAVRALTIAVAALAPACARAPGPSPVLAAAVAEPAAFAEATAPAGDDPRCVGVPARASDADPLEGPVLSVRPIPAPDRPYASHNNEWGVRGAELRVAARPGLTREWLERLVDCAVARAATAPSPSPLAVPGVVARVESLRGAFAIELRARTIGDAEEVLRRAQALAPSPRP